jgi:hypothetical protein
MQSVLSFPMISTGLTDRLIGSVSASFFPQSYVVMLFFDQSIFSLFYILYVISTAAAPTSDLMMNHNDTSTGIPFQWSGNAKFGCPTADGTVVKPYDNKVDVANT